MGDFIFVVIWRATKIPSFVPLDFLNSHCDACSAASYCSWVLDRSIVSRTFWTVELIMSPRYFEASVALPLPFQSGYKPSSPARAHSVATWCFRNTWAALRWCRRSLGSGHFSASSLRAEPRSGLGRYRRFQGASSTGSGVDFGRVGGVRGRVARLGQRSGPKSVCGGMQVGTELLSIFWAFFPPAVRYSSLYSSSIWRFSAAKLIFAALLAWNSDFRRTRIFRNLLASFPRTFLSFSWTTCFTSSRKESVIHGSTFCATVGIDVTVAACTPFVIRSFSSSAGTLVSASALVVRTFGFVAILTALASTELPGGG